MPFCPACRYEYREGVTRCSTCGASLVGAMSLAADRQPRTGFAPLDRLLNWFARVFPSDQAGSGITRFCPVCRYEYREGETHCYTCGAALVGERPRDLLQQVHLGFAPLDGAATWFVHGPFGRWITTARRDLVSIPRFFARGAVAVFRNPALYLLPLLFFAGNHYLAYSFMRAQEGAFISYETVTDRLSTASGLFANAISPDGAGELIREPLPLVPGVAPSLGLWYQGSQGPYLLRLVVFWVLTALFYVSMFARLKSQVRRDAPHGFLAGIRRYFPQMAGVVAVNIALSVSFSIGVSVPSSPAFNSALSTDSLMALGLVWSVCCVLAALAFAVAPYAAVVDGCQVHRALLASAKFVFRHLPAVVLLLVAVTFAQWLIHVVIAPVHSDIPYGRILELRQLPGDCLQMLFALCLWGMVMEWYVAARRPAGVT